MLLDVIKNDALQARKSRDKEKATLLVTLLAEASRPGKDAGNRDSTDAEVIKIVGKFINDIDFSLTVLTDPEAIARAKQERSILAPYLPAQLSNEGLKQVIDSLVEALPEKTPKGVGIVMSELRRLYAGAYDGMLASKLVKAALA